MWPAVIVQHLAPLLPADFTAEPRVHLGAFFEIDVCAYERDEPSECARTSEGSGGVATATWAPPQPTLRLDADLADQYEYEVLVYDQSRGRQLVAAVELVSPGNKDRPENRRALATKCAALLQQGVCVSIVDLVTTRHFNLYTELLGLLDRSDPAFAPDAPSIYAVTCRGRRLSGVSKLEVWAHPLTVGQPLPTLPLWLSEDVAISLDLEASYEATCSVLRIG
jgi:hypothetical protein